MPNQDEIRKRVGKTYQSAQNHLRKVVKVDDPETKKAIKHLHKALNLQFELESLNDNDYQLACLSNEGLARAYCQVTAGVNPEDVEYQREQAKLQFEKIKSPLVRHSILCQSLYISGNEEKDEERSFQLIK